MALDNIDKLISKLEDVAKPLGSVSDLAGTVKSEVELLVANVKAPETAIHSVSVVSSIVNTIDSLCKYVSIFPAPIKTLANLVRNAITKTIRPPLKSISDSLAELNATILKPIDETVDKAKPTFDKIEISMHEMAQLITTLITMMKVLKHGGAMLVHIAGIVDDEKLAEDVNKLMETYDGLAAEVLREIDKLEQNVNSLSASVPNLIAVVEPVRTFLANANETIVKPFNNATSKVQVFADVCQTVRDCLWPLEWVLDCFQWIIDKILGPAIKWLLDVLGITNLFNKFVNGLAKLFGFDKIKEFVEKLFQQCRSLANEVFSDVTEPVVSLMDLKAIIEKHIEEFSSDELQARAEQLAKRLADAPDGVRYNV